MTFIQCRILTSMQRHADRVLCLNHIIGRPERSVLPTALLHHTNQNHAYSYKIVYT